MLYLITPGQPLKWTDLPHRTVEIPAVRGADLSGLDWREVEHFVGSDADVVALALRVGVPVVGGVVVAGTDMSVIDRPVRLRRELEQFRQFAAKQPASHRDLLESVLPGWTRRDDELSDGTQNVLADSIREADAERAEILGKPLDPTLSDHWTSLGGPVYTER